MIFMIARVARTSWGIRNVPRQIAMGRLTKGNFSTFCPCYQVVKDDEKAEKPRNPTNDPRVNDLGRAIEDDYATIRAKYSMFYYLAHWITSKAHKAKI